MEEVISQQHEELIIRVFSITISIAKLITATGNKENNLKQSTQATQEAKSVLGGKAEEDETFLKMHSSRSSQTIPACCRSICIRKPVFV